MALTSISRSLSLSSRFLASSPLPLLCLLRRRLGPRRSRPLRPPGSLRSGAESAAPATRVHVSDEVRRRRIGIQRSAADGEAGRCVRVRLRGTGLICYGRARGEEEAKKKIYNVSCERYFGFGCEIDEETSNKLEGLPGVLFVLPDSYVDAENKDYGAELFVNGEIVQRSPERQRRVEPAPQRAQDRPSSRGALTVGLPPAWVDVSEEISVNMQRARAKMLELGKAHSKALMPSFGDSREDHHVIEVLTHEITDLLRKSEKRLQMLSSSEHSEDSNVRRNVQRLLATDLQNLSMEFRKKQSSYLKRLRLQKEGQDDVDLEMNMNGTKSKMEDDGFDDIGFSETHMSKLKKSEAFTQEREREIVQVVESVNELALIMKDLSVLVIDQGTIIDRIDYNVQNVAASVEEGYKQLQKAERTQKKGGMVMCATVLVIMCFVMLLLLILKSIFF
ncbi:uncharacterized protein A4U43_C08F1040 [Asparagus officinalis]|nr:uncharacterized protein A4U43_C08F1040 [Asparagus officinalis]